MTGHHKKLGRAGEGSNFKAWIDIQIFFFFFNSVYLIFKISYYVIHFLFKRYINITAIKFKYGGAQTENDVERTNASA